MNKGKKDDRKGQDVLTRLLSVALALLAWQAGAAAVNRSILLPTPLSVCRRLIALIGEDGFLPTLFFSLGRVSAGFLLGTALGLLLGALAGRYGLVETLLWPWMLVVKAVPVASFVVICLIWLKSRNLSVFIAFLVVLPVIYQNMLSGIRALDIKLAEMAAVFHMPFWRRVRYIVLPQLMPYLSSAGRTTVSMAWKAAIAAEIIGTPGGSIGKQVYLSKTYLDTDTLLAWTVVVVLMGGICEKLVALLIQKLGSHVGAPFADGGRTP